MALATAWLLSGAASAHAVTTHWGGDLTGNWFSDLAWSVADVVPKAADTASFEESSGGISFVITDVALSGSTTISALVVLSPMSDEWTFTGSNGAILTATLAMFFYNEDYQSLNVHRIVSLGLNTPQVQTYENAILSLSNSTVTTDMVSISDTSRVDVGDGARVLTNRYRFNEAGGELRVYSGGELRVVTDNPVLRGTTTILAGGQLNALPGVDLEYNGTALLQFGGFHAVDDQVHLKATGGGDITAASYLDVGNGVTGSLTVTRAGSTLTAGNISDWGLDSSGAATVTVANSGVATVATLRAGTGDASFTGNVTSSGKLQTTSAFSMGGGSALRTVELNVNGGTFETDGLATFNNGSTVNQPNARANGIEAKAISLYAGLQRTQAEANQDSEAELRTVVRIRLTLAESAARHPGRAGEVNVEAVNKSKKRRGDRDLGARSRLPSSCNAVGEAGTPLHASLTCVSGRCAKCHSTPHGSNT